MPNVGHFRTTRSSKVLVILHSSLGRVSYLEGERNFAKGGDVCKLHSRKSRGPRADSPAVGNHLMGHIYFSSVTLGETVDRCKTGLLCNRTSATAFAREAGMAFGPSQSFSDISLFKKTVSLGKTAPCRCGYSHKDGKPRNPVKKRNLSFSSLAFKFVGTRGQSCSPYYLKSLCFLD